MTASNISGGSTAYYCRRRELADGVPYDTVFFQTWETLFFGIRDGSRKFVVCFVCVLHIKPFIVHTSYQSFVHDRPGKRPPRITRNYVNTVTLCRVGRNPYASAPFQSSCRSGWFCRSMSVEDLEARRFILNIRPSFSGAASRSWPNPTSAPPSFLFRGFPKFGTFGLKNCAHNKLYLKN